jgi:hypothetical protein
MKKILLVLGLLLLSFNGAQAQSQRNPCSYTTENPGPGNGCTPVSSATPLPIKSGSYVSAGTGQFALAVTTNTQLTVPTGAICAEITVEGASVRRTSDTTSATTTNGTLIQSGAQWQDCGPLAAYKFTAVSGTPTLDVEYFR